MADIKKTFQNTIKDKVTFVGKGLFTGKKVKMSLLPEKEDSGIVFKRTDLEDALVLPAKLNFVKETDKRTLIGFGEKKVETVEHILSVLAAYNIDNLLIEIDGPEIPIADGSSKIFAQLIEKTGIQKQNKLAKVLYLKQAVHFSENNTYIVALPADEYRISFTLHHPSSKILNAQYFSYLVDKKTYLQEIAPCRTYSIYEEIKALLDNNFIKGGSLDNAVLIKDDKVLNPEGIRFSDEMVRHKILDLMGDLNLIGNRFFAHIIAIRSGHLTNIKFAKKLKTFLEECKN